MLVLAHPVLSVLVIAAPLAAFAWHAWEFLVPPLAWMTFALVGKAVARPELPGVPVRPADEPELAEIVSRTAEQLGFRCPVAIRVVPVVDASLMATNLRGSPAFALLLGWPLLKHLDTAEVTAIVGHELAHQQHLDDRWTARLLRARSDLVESAFTLVRAPRFLRLPLLRATQQVSWNLEYAADQDAARLAGRAAAQQALIDVDRLTAVYDSLAVQWQERLHERGEYPEDVYDAMTEALRDPHVQDRIDALLARPEPEEIEASHPPVAARMAAVGVVAEDVRIPRGPVPIREPERFSRECAELMRDPDLKPVRILELDPEVLSSRHDDMDDLLIKATSQPDLRRAMVAALDAVADGTWPSLAKRLEPGLRHAPDDYEGEAALIVVGGCLGEVLAHGLLGAGWQRASRWTHSVLLSPVGEEVRVRALVDQALDTGDVSELTPLLAAAQFPQVAA